MKSDPVEREASVHAIGGKAASLLELQLEGFPVPEFLCSPSDLDEAVRLLGFPLAVRSSASAEDGRDISFAGQFRSFLNLTTLEEVAEAVRLCRTSLDEPSVEDYCRRQGVAFASMRMGVIVQHMLQPDLAGVAFTVNPLTGAEEVVIEACEGVADDLLAGTREPLPAGHPLVVKHATEIEAMARAVQRHFGCPQDIEFAIEGERLYLLQARPVTRIAFGAEASEWTNADFRDGGVSATVCTPLMWSLYDFIWEAALKGFLREIRLLDGDFEAGRMFFGRPYWNLGEVKKCLARLPGFVERVFDEDLSAEPRYEGDGHRTPVNLWTIVRALPSIFAIERVWKSQDAFDQSLLDGGFDALEEKYRTVPADAIAGLRELIENGYRVVETNYFHTIFCASLAKMDFTEAFPDADYAALVSGLPELKHFEPVRVMAGMKQRGEHDIGPLLERFRHLSRRELDIRTPRWDEDRAWVESVFDQSGEQPNRRRPQVYRRAFVDALRALPRRKRAAFRKKLARLRRFLWLREDLRDLSTRMYYHIRRHVTEIARQQGLGDDVFFMTFQEILAGDRSQVERGRECYESYRNFQAPNEIGDRYGDRENRPSPVDAEGALRGIAASRGVARGPAFVARTIEEAMGARTGDILVCPSTDPGWTPVLARVGGVVTGTGGMLSHAAVICREFGIPAVLGVPGVMKEITSGNPVVVDGNQGSVFPDKS
jgi:phosphohistidine swiveling domain-containing protein